HAALSSSQNRGAKARRRFAAFQPQTVDQPTSQQQAQSCLPWQCLYFLPDPHGHSALRETLPQVAGSFGLTAPAGVLRVCNGARRSDCPLGLADRAASAMASSSSPVNGSTWCACMGGNATGSMSGSSSGTP